ncbi:hypothetical protein PHLGIDRAFT_357118 [Phlebiopsis gigantea 11061_1 CR5-6]|uniref:Uncharacterized protein n=1 Tax=Phlebiopsis gigantea (strain 11061_1 CR5-6) TaxID=745531 RepID=A0A0C3S1C0_PHLG1|nr:hypothetical protein PHLGIDRAFT_357118 [Phlebiopsis gigantea 11061_1 CR5-6]
MEPAKVMNGIGVGTLHRPFHPETRSERRELGYVRTLGSDSDSLFQVSHPRYTLYVDDIRVNPPTGRLKVISAARIREGEAGHCRSGLRRFGRQLDRKRERQHAMANKPGRSMAFKGYENLFVTGETCVRDFRRQPWAWYPSRPAGSSGPARQRSW